MELRPYQLEIVDGVRVALRPKVNSMGLPGEGLRRVCVVLSTGGGKTVIISKMVKGAAANKSIVWVIAHREELIFQISETLGFFGVHHGIIKPGVPETNSHVQVAMIQTLKNRVGKLQMPDMVIVDECHHTPSATYDYLLSLLPPETKIIGFTATPERLDGKGLGRNFDKLVQGPSISELINMGYLVPPKLIGPPGVDTSKLRTRAGDFAKDEAAALLDETRHIGDVVQTYRRFAKGLSAVVFAVSIKHAKHLAEQFNEAGFPAAHIDGGMKRDERKSILDAFRSKSVLILVSVDLISEGFDLPSIEVCILDRPTKSLAMYMQQVGRALRPAPGKTHAIIIDHVENWMRHGQPDEDRNWLLYEEIPKNRRGPRDISNLRTCPDCLLVYDEDYCPACGITDRDKEGIIVERIAGELVLIEPKRRYLEKNEFESLKTVTTAEDFIALRDQFKLDDATARKMLVNGAKTLADLQRVGKILGYKDGWAQHRYVARHGWPAYAAAVKLLNEEKEQASA